MKREKIHIATYSENAVQVAKTFGFGIELNDCCYSEMLDAELVRDTIKGMKKEIADAGTDKIVLHGPFTEIIPSAIDHRCREMGMARLNEAYKVCEELGVKKMVVHSGYMPPLYFKEWHRDKSIEFWNKFMEDKPEDFHIAIENVLEDEPIMLKELKAGLPDNRISLCIDIGHANWNNNGEYTVEEWIKILGEDITHFHLHNNYGKNDDHNPITEGTMDIRSILSTIEKYSPNATLTIESRVSMESAAFLDSLIKEQL